MALGGGNFLTQNKVLPGSYINFVSATSSNASISDRGYAAAACEMSWGKEGQIFAVTADEFMTESMSIFGYAYTDGRLKGIRDIFLNASTVYFYRLNNGTKASCDIASARYSGERGNDIVITIESGESGYIISTYLDGTCVDTQNVFNAGELADNDYVVFNKSAEMTLSAGMNLAGGTDGSTADSAHQKFLDSLESISINTLACLSDNEAVKKLYAQYTKTMRDTYGVKFQTVVHDYEAEYEGVINVDNCTADKGEEIYGLVWWTAGASAGCAINESLTNKLYDGEYSVNTAYKQSELEEGIKAGKLMFHRNGEDIRVLDDINSYTEFKDGKDRNFAENQVIRLLDQIGNDIAVMFNTYYLGKVQNNTAGRMAFWNDIVTYNRELEKLSVIEGFEADDVAVEIGNDKKTVSVTNPITPVCTMAKLYMTVIVR
ncbi:phage tail sheath family protein [Lachnospiraceae bacterium NSJ-143]|nr:phage tail sheath family protein [Lachnospiraceae bacterium NSJ-143]